MGDEASTLVTLLGGGGGAVVLVALINGTMKWLSGMSHRERVRNTDLATQRKEAIEAKNKAEKELDVESRKRREAEEHVSILKRQLLVNGFAPIERQDNTEEEQE